MRLKRWFGRFLTGAVLLAVVVGCGSPAAPGAGADTSKQAPSSAAAGKEAPKAAANAAPKDVIRWKAITYMADNSPFVAANREWAKAIETRSGGRLVTEWFTGGSMVGSNEELNAVGKGIADVALLYFGYYPNELYVTTINGIPALSPESLEAQSLIMDEVAKTAAYKAEFDKYNVQQLFFSASPVFAMIGKKPIRKIEDFKGVKVRAVSGTADIVQRIGGTPVNISQPESFTALNNGLVDLVAASGLASMMSNKYNEISKYYIPGVPLGGGGLIAIVNKNSYAKLPQDIKDMFVAMVPDQAKVYQRVLAGPDAVNKAMDDFKSRGIETLPFPKAEQDKVMTLAKPMWDEWAAAGKDRGAREVLDAYLAAMKKYEGK